MYSLTIINKKNSEFGSIDDFANLVVTLICIKSTLLSKTMGFICNKSSNRIMWCFNETATTYKHVVNISPSERSVQFGRIDISRS